MSHPRRNRAALFGALTIAVAVTTACDDDPIAAPADQNLVQVASDAGAFSTLITAVQAAGLEATLANDGPFTIFAPSDAAFAALPAGTLDLLLQDPDQLARILRYHIVSGTVLAADVSALTSAKSLLGGDLNVDATSGVKINGVTVSQTDILADNGVIHVIDEVLIPNLVQVADGVGSFQTLIDAAVAASLDGTLATGGPFTVFAPTDMAFAALPAAELDILLQDPAQLADVLRYHLVPGSVLSDAVVNLTSATTVFGGDISIDATSGVTVDGVTVSMVDQLAYNGVIHVIDQVLLPNIVQIAVANGSFNTLVQAVVVAGLDATLSGPGAFTVFAPTDDAFSKLPAGTLTALLQDIPALTDILRYHVVPGKVLSADVVAMTSATTLQGSDITIDTSSGVKVDGANVVLTDRLGRNGVVHVIDAVLIP